MAEDCLKKPVGELATHQQPLLHGPQPARAYALAADLAMPQVMLSSA